MTEFLIAVYDNNEIEINIDVIKLEYDEWLMHFLFSVTFSIIREWSGHQVIFFCHNVYDVVCFS
jgi:hypothetical protein